ncbi:MAG: response regulator [Planctomycetes bacterium]|nr:response regulator [Planctomycetota bacterium]
MNIKVHTSLVLTACTLTGLVLGAYLVDRYRQVDVGMAEVGETSVTLRNCELLTKAVGQWLIVNDLVLYQGESTMLKVSIRNAGSLRELLADISSAPAFFEHGRAVETLRETVKQIETKILASRDLTGTDRLTRLAELAEETQPLSDRLFRDVGELNDALQIRAGHRQEDLIDQERSLTILAWLVAILYFGVVWLCWLWIVHRVVVPIEGLSAAAGRADHDGREFVLPQTGPDEVRQLTQNISSFVLKLQRAKAGTEEEVRQRTAELVQANRAKGQFLATMSHELRTPLNGIINMNELILETQLDQEQTSFARTAKSAAEALLALINDILDFSKIEARKLDLENVQFDLRSVVDASVEILTGVAESKGLEIQAVVDAEVPVLVTGDPTRLRQVLINLLNNALKFTAEGGVSTHVSAIGSHEGGAMLRFEVRDTGIGIPEERRASLFRAFEQVDSSTTRKYGGTGLGLAICRELTALMGGEISVDSVEGEGSTFWFTSRLGTVETRAPEPVDVGDRGVVIVSRRPNLAARIVQQLRMLGMQQTAILTVDDLVEFDPGTRSWFAIIDPYSRDDGGFDDVGRARANHGILGSGIAVLDHWMRHWPGSLGTPPGDVTKLLEPTTVDGLRGWLVGEVVPVPVMPEAEGCVANRESAPSMASAPSPTGRTTILVVEDTEVNQRVVTSVLARGGYDVVVAGDGLQAVEAFERQAFDLVLMDCQMPVMDGLEATRRIRALELERTASSSVPLHVPIIALTANAQDGFDRECLAAGMDRFLSKPCRRQPLLAAIEECLAGKRGGASAEDRVAPRILVADDDAINRKVAESVLGRAGYRIVLVENGQEAVDRATAEPFDLVLMDCQMPVLNGLEASRQIRELEAAGGLAGQGTRRLPIVALTGNVQASDRADVSDAGMDEFVAKPFRPKDLLEVVARLAGPGGTQ